jgi:hypothetical protein
MRPLEGPVGAQLAARLCYSARDHIYELYACVACYKELSVTLYVLPANQPTKNAAVLFRKHVDTPQLECCKRIQTAVDV